MRYLVTGGAGFIGSHLVDRLIADGHSVTVLDNLSSGKNVNPQAHLIQGDIRVFSVVHEAMQGVDGVFHCAAIARTPWTIEDPILAMGVNLMGSVNVLEAARQRGVKRVVMSSSCIVYAKETPYKAGKVAMEEVVKAYQETYGLSVVCLRYSNVYGPRQSEEGVSPNVFAALRKSKRELGKLIITGDGEQTRDYTHVLDIVEGNLAAMKKTDVLLSIDLCTGINTSLNEVAKFFGVPDTCEIEYVEERKGDIKHLEQDPFMAWEQLAWKAKIKLEDGIKDVL